MFLQYLVRPGLWCGLSFPFQQSIRVWPQYLLPPGPTLSAQLARLPHTSTYLPPSLPWSYFTLRGCLVSIRALVPLSLGEAPWTWDTEGLQWTGSGNRGPERLLSQFACVLPRILKLFLIFLRIGQGTWKTSFRPSPLAKLMSIGCSMAQRQLECPVYKGLWIICK